MKRINYSLEHLKQNASKYTMKELLEMYNSKPSQATLFRILKRENLKTKSAKRGRPTQF